MTTKRKPSLKKLDIKKPENFELEKARVAVERLIRENKEWVKEMAKK